MPARAPHMVTLVLTTALTVLTLNMFLPALPQMQRAFGVSEAVMGLAISAYMVCAAGLQFVLGPLSDRLGRRPVLLGLLVVYICASVVCVLAQDITVFLGARLVQAVAVGGGIIASAVVRDISEGSEAAARLGRIAAVMAIAPMLAPIAGGFLEAALGWRSIFVVYTLMGAGLFTLVWFDLGETRHRMPQRGSARVLLTTPLYWAHVLCAAFSVGAFFVFLTGAPFVAAAVFGLSSAQIGLGLGSITGGFMVGATLSSRYVKRLGEAKLILMGRLLALFGPGMGLLIFTAGAGNVWVLFAGTMLIGFGNGLTVPNVTARLMSIRPELAGTAAGVSGATMLSVGAGLTALATAVLTNGATPERLLLLILVSVAASLIAALAARRLG